MSDFVKVTNLKSPAWKYFKRKVSTSQALCNECGTILKTTGSSTKNLLDHLRNKHKINSTDANEARSSELEESRSSELEKSRSSKASKRPRSTLMTDHFEKKDELSLDFRISRMCAVNLFNFNQLATRVKLTRDTHETTKSNISSPAPPSQPPVRQGLNGQHWAVCVRFCGLMRISG